MLNINFNSDVTANIDLHIPQLKFNMSLVVLDTIFHFFVFFASRDETSLEYIKKTVQRTTQIENRSCASPNIPAICIDTHADVWSLAFGSPGCNGPLNDNRWVYHDTSGLLLATGQANGRIKLWKIENGKLLTSWKCSLYARLDLLTNHN